MSARVLTAARRAGVAQELLPRLTRAHSIAMKPRIQQLDAGAHELLHPGRCALILVLDVGERDAETLAAGMLVESERPELSVANELVGEELGRGISERIAGIPLSGSEDLLEWLVSADDEVQRIALAERLDQLRHAHLWSDPERRLRAYEEAVAVYSPLAERVHPTLARRYAWWCSMFARKYLAGP